MILNIGTRNVAILLACLTLATKSAKACPYRQSRDLKEAKKVIEHDDHFPALEQKKADSVRFLQAQPGSISSIFNDFWGWITQLFQGIFNGGSRGNNNSQNTSNGGAVTPITGLSTTQAIADARADIVTLINSQNNGVPPGPHIGGGGYGRNRTLQGGGGNFIAKFVRLAFHDCIGGCDGCVDLSDSSNFGLNEPIQALSDVVTRYSETLTRADLWVLAGLVAAESAQTRCNNNNGGTNNIVAFEMQFTGRSVCPEENPVGGPKRSLPSAHFVTDQVVEFFSTNFGFSEEQAVAILGAHTL
jgi:Peroxidase